MWDEIASFVLPVIVPVIVLALGFVAGFGYRHLVSKRRERRARSAFFDDI